MWDNVRKLSGLHGTVKEGITLSSDARNAARHTAEAIVTYSLRRTPSSDTQDNTTAIVVVVGAEAAAAAAAMESTSALAQA